MEKRKVLFICVHNAARSQMAEAFLNDLGAGVFEAYSAGFAPTRVTPIVVEVMKELGYDLSECPVRSVFALYKAGMLFNYVITVCRESTENKCPIFPGITKRLHWRFDDPAALQGTDTEKLEEARRIRDEIKSKIESWLVETKDGSGQRD
jgi:arsenate reductase (thioredoxin)